ncbi:UDP-galactose translocator-like isoform X1 [Penaeus chinensis]|uniref:UDP-galactose translocator-like isoform X1 n=1 Tax=Penaeus chinensis TaxID=139456 RepID=UPI001FB6B5DB|nr:UDP-galactose translocator-like isoform X1 [Penaeus chinensis]
MGSDKNAQGHILKYVSLVTLTVQNSAVALSMRYARTRSGDMFIASTAVVMAEFVKLLASLFLVWKQEGSVQHWFMALHTQIWQQKLDTLKVCVPSFIYLVQNNLLYVSASNLDAATYQVTYQMKILTTAMFAVLILRKQLRGTQWLALVFLTAGVALVQLSSTDTGSSASSSDQNRLLGCVAAIAACCCSGFAGIYFEKILKGSDVSVWVRNVQLSFLSLPLGVMTAYMNDFSSITEKGFFFGYDGYVAYLIVLNAVGGLLVAMVVKYADNILKGFATSLAIVLSTIASVFMFGFVITFQFAVGTAMVIGSIFLYSHEPKKPTANPMGSTTGADENSCA